MDLWHKLIKDGEQASARKQYQLADAKFRLALERSKFLYYRRQNKSESIHCISESYQLVSKNLLALGWVEPACNSLFKGHQLFCSLSLLVSTYHAEIRGTELSTCLSNAKSRLASAISDIVKENPGINVCEDCYLRVFGSPRKYQALYSVN